jgi:ribosomal protein S1
MLMVIRVDPRERRIGLSLKDLAAEVEAPEAREGRDRRRRKKSRGGFDDDEDE